MTTLDLIRPRPLDLLLDVPLTRRELIVLRHLDEPLTLEEIGLILFVSRNTIKTQVRSLYRKIGVTNRAGALGWARSVGAALTCPYPEGMQIVSVNVGRIRADDGRAATGIDKRPVDGPVLVTPPGPRGTGEVGLAGDQVADSRHHGGVDQAVYAYAREDLDAWEPELGRRLAAGTFGENLTTAGVPVTDALIGEHWRVGRDLVLEVCGPRIPCRTFEQWLRTSGWITRFTQAAVPGAYLRVLQPGSVRAGDTVDVVHRPEHDVTIGLTFRAMTLEPDLLARLLVADALPPEVLERARRRTTAPRTTGGPVRRRST